MEKKITSQIERKPRVSYVSKNKVVNFINKYPIVKEIGIGEKGLLNLSSLALKKEIPNTGLLACIFTYLNFEPVNIVYANNNEYLIYSKSDFTTTMVECAIRNKE